MSARPTPRPSPSPGLRDSLLVCLLSCGFAVLQPALAQIASATPPATAAGLPDGQRDFDWEIGIWKTHLKLLLNPLSDEPPKWAKLTGTSVIRKVWDGRSNMVELIADGAGLHIEGASWRLYNPKTRQWSLNFSNSRVGTLTPPVYGEFKDGVGVFYGQDFNDGRAVLVRFVITPITPDEYRFEQSYSGDGGKTWEVNWIATDTRVAGNP